MNGKEQLFKWRENNFQKKILFQGLRGIALADKMF